jgi:cytochrome P450
MDAFGFAKRLALRNSWKLLFGQDPKPGVDEKVDVLLSSALSPVTGMLPRVWPFPYYWVSKALRGLYAWAKEIAEDKRSNPDDSIASLMVNRREADGSLPSVEKIYGDMTGLYVTGRDGPASDIAWTLFLLAAHPTYQHSLREDLLGVSGYDSVLLAAIINESRRLFPPSFVLNPRICTTSYEFEGIQLPRGAMALGSILARHRDPEAWSNAQKFDPNRGGRGASSVLRGPRPGGDVRLLRKRRAHAASSHEHAALRPARARGPGCGADDQGQRARLGDVAQIVR